MQEGGKMKSVIAVPSAPPGGLEADLGQHFGHCEMYTLVTVSEGQVENVNIIPAIPHEQGGCMAPVNYLAQNGVNGLIAGHMGMRPLVGFAQMGIEVFQGGESKTVKEAVDSLLEGRLAPFGQEHACGGGAHDHPHDHDHH
jgi:predicted Fe-Mo cluster-binding NifX family protein